MSLLDETADLEKHFTVTGYVINETKTKLLLVHHKKLHKWLPPGGHIETNELPHFAALREIQEETGVKVRIINSPQLVLELDGKIDIQIPEPITISYQLIPRHNNIEPHIHIDMMYLFEADETSKIKPSNNEVHEVKWCTKGEIINSEYETFKATISFVKKYLC